ncbi:MAG: hypothetical protein Q8K12_12240 [Thiobacillus sp.]|nr:hypothetical protein [Thiobacillus sp.]
MPGIENSSVALAAYESDAQNKIARLDELLAEATKKLAKISKCAAAAESSAAVVAENQTLCVAALADAQIKVAETAAAATQAIAAKTQIVDDQTVIATKSDHIQQAQEHADKVRGDMDRALTAAMQQATEAEGLKSRAQSASDTAASLLIEVKALKIVADTEGNAITDMHDAAEEAANVTKNLATRSETIEARIADYENQLAILKSKSESKLETIVGLLPGATSAGLAHAFDQRRQAFLKPSIRWQRLFVGSVIALVLLALSGLWNVYKSPVLLTYDELLRLWLARLPIAGALVWLALYAGRESALAKRLEEGYGYKSAIASSFLGFHKQMSEIGEQAETNTPLATLCTDTLATISSPPGRIYEKHKLTVSPATELTEAANSMVEAVNR